MQLYKLALLIFFPLLLSVTVCQAEETLQEENIDEELLLFLADMTVSGEDVLDPLDMLEIESQDLIKVHNEIDAMKVNDNVQKINLLKEGK